MKDVAVQTQLESNAGPRVLSKKPLPEFEFPQILYKPHTVFWLLLSICVLGYYSLSRDDFDSRSNYKQGFVTAIALLIFVSAVQLPDSPFLSRPHPVL
jgi:hypothetical protein